MIKFDTIIPIILKREGGYVNDPKDSGGETKFGISKRAYPNEDIKNLTIERAKEIYYQDYWKPLNLHLLNSGFLAIHVFDMAVNAGRKTAVKMLQRIIKTTVDGAIGFNTARAANNTVGVVENYIIARENYYKNLVIKRPKNAKFLKGWLNRVELVSQDYERTYWV